MRNFFLPKQDQRLPDAYEMTIQFADGTKRTFECASHHMAQYGIEIVQSEDLFAFLPYYSIKSIDFDKRFSKIVALKQEAETRKQNG